MICNNIAPSSPIGYKLSLQISGPGSNSHEGILHTAQIFPIEASPLYMPSCHIHDSPANTVNIFLAKPTEETDA